MSAISATAIYWVIQIIIWIYALYIFTRIRDRPKTTTIKRDSPAMRVVMFLAIPAMSFGYFLAPSLLTHKPIEKDQLWLSVICAVLISIVTILRFRRQDRAQ